MGPNRSSLGVGYSCVWGEGGGKTIHTRFVSLTLAFSFSQYPLHLLNLSSVGDFAAKLEKDDTIKPLDPRRFRANIIGACVALVMYLHDRPRTQCDAMQCSGNGIGNG